MLMSAADVYRANLAGETVPDFAWLLFARDMCQSPADLLINHLNKVGDSAGLDQASLLAFITHIFTDQ